MSRNRKEYLVTLKLTGTFMQLDSTADKSPEYYHQLVKKIGNYEHITVEVNKR